VDDKKKTKAQLIEEMQQLRSECEAAREVSSGQTPMSSQMFYDIMQRVNDAILSINTDGIVKFFNKKAEDMFGYTAAEIVGGPPDRLIIEEMRAYGREMVKKHSRNAATGLIALSREIVVVCKDGSILPVEISYYGHYLDGKYCMTGVLRDISERKRAQKALEEARDFLDNIIESSLDPIVITDGEGHITRSNSAFLKLLGVEKQDQIIGQHIMTFSPDKEGKYETTTGECVEIDSVFLKTVKSLMSRVRQADTLPTICGYYRRCDNRLVPTEYTINLLFDQNKDPIGAMAIIRDVTERKHAEKKLKDSKDFLINLFEITLDGLLVSDAQGYITMANERAAAMLRYSKNELIGKHPALFTPMQEKESARQLIEKLITCGTLIGEERTWIRGDGSLVTIEINVSLMKDTDGNITGSFSSIRDISERRKADMAIRASEERYRRIFENAFVAIQEEDISPLMSAIHELKSAGVNMRTHLNEHPEFIDEAIGMATIMDVNAASLKMYGAKDKEELLHSMDKILREESLPALREALIALAEGKSFFQTETIHYTLQGEQKHVLLQGNFLIKQRDLNRVLISIIDITQIKAAEKKLLDYQQQLRSLTNELISKEENERRNLGMYLHDRIGQSLSVLKMQLEMLASELAGSDDRDKCKSILKTIDQTIHDTRVLSYELSPVILHELGLEVALSWLAEQTERQYKIAVAFKSDKKAMRLDDGLKIILYRSVHELLNNVVKHAWAQHVAVSIKRSNGQVQITVEDDGVGFDPTELEGIAATERGFGLFSIRERLHYLGGSILIESALYKGTRITLLVPLK